MCRAACPRAVWSAHHGVSGSRTVVKAVLLTSLQGAPKRQWRERDWMSHYDVWCGKSLRPYCIYTYQDKRLSYPILAIGDNVFHKAVMLNINQKQYNPTMWLKGKLLVVSNREGTNTATIRALHDDWQHFKTEDVWWKNSAGITIVFMAKQIRLWQKCVEPDSKHATYPSLYEASWRADARMSISMRLSCKVSRNVCFAMFLHTGGKMDMKLVWDVRARNTEMPIQYVITRQQHQQQ